MENTNQFLHLSEPQMLDLWKTVLRLQPVRRDCAIERDDGVDLDALLLIGIKQWYAHLLATAPVEWLPIEDVKAQVTLTADDEGIVTASVPPSCVRPIEWRLHGWRRSVTRFLVPGDAETEVQYSPWTRGNCNQPAGIDCGSRLVLFGAMAGTPPTLAMARCVVRPADGTYSLHQAALSTIPGWNLTHPFLI